MKKSIAELEIVKIICSETRKDIDNVTALTVIIKDELKIPHEKINTAYRRKEELSQLIKTATTTISRLNNDTEAIVNYIQKATTKNTETVIGDATSYITSHNDKLLHKMETVFRREYTTDGRYYREI